MNNCSLIGTLGRDWEVKISQDGKPIAKNSMAIRKFNGESFWLNLTIFGKRAESAAQYSGKGDKFGASGALDIQDYEGKDGVKKQSVSLLVSDFDFLGTKKDASQGNQQPQQQYQQRPNQTQNQQQYPQQQQFNMVPPDDESIPF